MQGYFRKSEIVPTGNLSARLPLLPISQMRSFWTSSGLAALTLAPNFRPGSGALIVIRTSLPTQPQVVANAQSIIDCDILRPVDELRPDHPASNNRCRYEVHVGPASLRRPGQCAMPRTVRSERCPTRRVIAGQRRSGCCDPNRIQSRFAQHAFVTAVPVKTTQAPEVAIKRENKNENDVDCFRRRIGCLRCDGRVCANRTAFRLVPVRSELQGAGPRFRHAERLGSQSRR